MKRLLGLVLGFALVSGCAHTVKNEGARQIASVTEDSTTNGDVEIENSSEPSTFNAKATERKVARYIYSEEFLQEVDRVASDHFMEDLKKIDQMSQDDAKELLRDEITRIDEVLKSPKISAHAQKKLHAYQKRLNLMIESADVKAEIRDAVVNSWSYLRKNLKSPMGAAVRGAALGMSAVSKTLSFPIEVVVKFFWSAIAGEQLIDLKSASQIGTSSGGVAPSLTVAITPYLLADIANPGGLIAGIWGFSAVDMTAFFVCSEHTYNANNPKAVQFCTNYQKLSAGFEKASNLVGGDAGLAVNKEAKVLIPAIEAELIKSNIVLRRRNIISTHVCGRSADAQARIARRVVARHSEEILAMPGVKDVRVQILKAFEHPTKKECTSIAIDLDTGAPGEAVRFSVGDVLDGLYVTYQ